MLEYLRPTRKGTEKLKRAEPHCWINAVQPTDVQMQDLRKIIPITPSQIDLLNDPDQIPAVDEQKDYTFIIAQAPIESRKDKFGYRTVPIGIFVTKDKVATVCFFHDEALEMVKLELFEFRKTQVVFRLLRASAKLYHKYLKEIRQKMYVVENYLSETIGNKYVLELLELEQSLTYFDTALRSNKVLLERLAKEERTNKFIMIKSEEDEKLIEHMSDLSDQAIEVANVYSTILANMLNAFASIISNNLNNIIRVLTSVTIVIALPTLIASIYGMNISLPLQNHPNAFFIVMVFSFASSLLLLMMLVKKKFI
jgi:magnesium transporter